MNEQEEVYTYNTTQLKMNSDPCITWVILEDIHCVKGNEPVPKIQNPKISLIQGMENLIHREKECWLLRAGGRGNWGVTGNRV
jgi:hypothetical protein